MGTFYNFGNVSHFVADCPYGKREDTRGKLIRKYKAKPFPNKNNLFNNKPQKVLVAQEEYLSNENEDDDASGEVMGMYIVAIASSSTSKVSLFNAPTRTPLQSALWPRHPTR